MIEQEIVEPTVEEVPCPICGPVGTRTRLDEGKGTRYVECIRCHTVFASPRRSRQRRVKELTTRFNAGAFAFDNAARREPALATEAALIQRLMPEGRLLDVGCDTGNLFKFFDRSRFTFHGVELAPGAAQYARETFKADVFAGTLHEARLPESFFDIVTVLDTFYYVDDPRRELMELHRVLKPGGLLAVEIPGQKYHLLRGGALACRLLDHQHARVTSDSDYLYWFTASSLNQLLAVTGFRHLVSYVIPSPDSQSPLVRALTRAHYVSMRILASVWAGGLDYSPKFLCVSRCEKEQSGQSMAGSPVLLSLRGEGAQ